MAPVAGRPEPSSEEVYNYFSEQMWRPSIMLWVGWPAVIACFACAVFTFVTYGINVFGGLLFLVAVGLAGYLIHTTLDQRKRWVYYISVSRSQINREFERPDSTVCLVQSFALGLRDRLLIVRRSDLHFKGYFMSAAKARRVSGALGIGYVESAKIISGVLPLKQIRKFIFRSAIRFRYVFLTLLGLGGGVALLPGVLMAGEHSRAELLGLIVFFVVGALSLALLFLHRLPLAIIRTKDYDLSLIADCPDQDTVVSFLRRLGYSDLRERARASSTRQSQTKERS